MPRQEAAPLVVILGPTGSGRTTVGAELARLLDADFSETEDLVHLRTGDSVRDLALQEDSARFNAAVGAAALEQLSGGGVVSLLPSAVSLPEVSERLMDLRDRGVPLVSLTADLSTLARRAGLNAPRSTSLGQPRFWFSQLVAKLKEDCASVGAREFDTSRRDAAQTAAVITEVFALD